jgi:hypothetical protein
VITHRHVGPATEATFTERPGLVSLSPKPIAGSRPRSSELPTPIDRIKVIASSGENATRLCVEPTQKGNNGNFEVAKKTGEVFDM